MEASQEVLAKATFIVHLMLVFPSFFHSPHSSRLLSGIDLKKRASIQSLTWALVFWGI